MKEQKEEEAITLYLHAELTQKEVAERIGLSEAEISRILQNCKYAEMEDFTPFLYNIWNTSKEEEVINLYLQAELTQTEISGKTGISQQEVGRIIQNTQMIDMDNFNPFLYNIWNLPSQDNSIKHFGLTEELSITFQIITTFYEG